MNCYKILTLLLVGALLISPAAGAEEESTWWDTTKDYADYAWETVKEHPWATAAVVAAVSTAIAGFSWYEADKAAVEAYKAAAAAAKEEFEFSQLERLVDSLLTKDPSQELSMSEIVRIGHALAQS